MKRDRIPAYSAGSGKFETIEEAAAAANDAITLSQQRLAIVRAAQILAEIYPARIAQKKATPQQSALHSRYLKAALATFDKLAAEEEEHKHRQKGQNP
jgi:hypothetical protein